MEFIVTEKKTLFRKKEKWSWRLQAGNGEIIATPGPGEKFHNEQDCLDSIKLVQSTDSSTTVRYADDDEYR